MKRLKLSIILCCMALAVIIGREMEADSVYGKPHPRPSVITGVHEHSGNPELDVVEFTVNQIVDAYLYLDLQNLDNNVTVKIYMKLDGTNYALFFEEAIASGDDRGFAFRLPYVDGDIKIGLDSTGNESPVKDVPFRIVTFRWGSQ